MSWVSDFLKHLSLSKAFTGALFITTSILLAGPQIKPTVVDPVPIEWRWLVTGLCIFSACYLAFWAIPPVFRSVIALPGKLINNPKLNPPTESENALLLLLGINRPSDSFDLDDLNISGADRLEFLESASKLEKRGLVRVNTYHSNIIQLTKTGRQYALELVRSRKET